MTQKPKAHQYQSRNPYARYGARKTWIFMNDLGRPGGSESKRILGNRHTRPYLSHVSRTKLQHPWYHSFTTHFPCITFDREDSNVFEVLRVCHPIS